jgi:hypothetical protein
MSKHAVRARAGQDRASLYNEITDKIIAELEAARVPWVQPWARLRQRPRCLFRKMLRPIVPIAALTFCFSGRARSNKVLQDKAGLRFARRCRLADTSAKVSAAPPWSTPTVSYRKTRSGAPPRPVTKRKRFHSSSALPYSTQISASRFLGDRHRRTATATRPDRAKGRSPDQGYWHHVSYWRQSRLLRTCRRLCAGPAASTDSRTAAP